MRRYCGALAPARRSLPAAVSITDRYDVQGFDEFTGGPYAAEARERWGDTDAYKESMGRTKTYGPETWARIKAEGEAPVTTLAELMKAGVAPTSTDATDAAERARLQIDRWFCPCSRAFQVNLSAMYEADPRFGEFYESRAPGLRDYLVAAIRANAQRSE